MLAKMIDGVCALSLEATEGFTECFSINHHDVSRPHINSMEVAATFRWLLDGSTLANKAKRKEQDPVAFRQVPTVHGSVRACLPLFLKAAKIELNSAEYGMASTPALEAQHDGALDGRNLTNACVSLAQALLAAAELALDRVDEIVTNGDKYGANARLAEEEEEVGDPAKAKDGKDTEDVAAAWSKSSKFLRSLVVDLKAGPVFTALSAPAADACVMLSKAVDRTRTIVALETAVALQVLAIRDARQYRSSLKAMQAKEQAQKKREEALAQQAAKKALEAGVAAGGDADAAAAKESSKKPVVAVLKQGKERQVKGITLGSGTGQFRDFIYKQLGAKLGGRSADAAAAGEAAGFKPVVCRAARAAAGDVVSIEKVLDPFDASMKVALDGMLTAVNTAVMPKLPKGTRDCTPETMAIREKAFKIIKEVRLIGCARM